ncbi:MAG: cytochrome c-type biogenesis protein CcmH [Deltaproteobacteria bacterium]|nr:cytochrome c-type biogenesis protein CcmH [Deltaproteobacteria bacterium]
MPRVILALLLVPFLFLSSPASAETPPATLNDAAVLFDSVMSPYCPGRTLSACPSDDARVLREEILASLVEGRSVEQEKERLISKYGPEILGTPADPRMRLASWGIPALFFLVGAIVLRGLVARRATVSKNEHAPIAVDPQMQARIEKELQARLSARSGS